MTKASDGVVKIPDLDDGTTFPNNNQKFKEIESKNAQKNASGRRLMGSILLIRCGSEQVDWVE